MATNWRTLMVAIPFLLSWSAVVSGQEPESRPAPGPDLVEVARAARATKDGDPKAALDAYDKAIAAFIETIAPLGTRVDQPTIALYKELVEESDKLVDKLETPEYEAKIAERDMLGTNERTLWGKSAGVDWTFGDKKLEVSGAEVPGRKITGLASILPPRSTPWHDLVIDLEFAILQGDCEMYLRYEPSKKAYLIRFNSKEGYELNKAYRMTIRVKGSSISLKAPDQPENRDKFQASTSRTGGIGFGLEPGSKVVISSCKLKVLR
jgi:hypothetical protein